MGDGVGRECGIISDPDITEQILDENKDRFIVIASDGVWDTLSNEEVR